MSHEGLKVAYQAVLKCVKNTTGSAEQHPEKVAVPRDLLAQLVNFAQHCVGSPEESGHGEGSAATTDALEELLALLSAGQESPSSARDSPDCGTAQILASRKTLRQLLQFVGQALKKVLAAQGLSSQLRRGASIDSLCIETSPALKRTLSEMTIGLEDREGNVAPPFGEGNAAQTKIDFNGLAATTGVTGLGPQEATATTMSSQPIDATSTIAEKHQSLLM